MYFKPFTMLHIDELLGKLMTTGSPKNSSSLSAEYRDLERIALPARKSLHAYKTKDEQQSNRP